MRAWFAGGHGLGTQQIENAPSRWIGECALEFSRTARGPRPGAFAIVLSGNM